MSHSFSSQAIVLNRRDYRENDNLVVFYTLNQGKKTLMARGVKRLSSKMAGHLDPFNLVDLMSIVGKNFDYVGSVIVRENFSNLKSDINCIYYAGLAFQWLQKILDDEQPDQEIYYLILQFLKQLELISITNEVEKNNNLLKAQGELYFAYFIIKLLSFSGYEPQTVKCLECHNLIVPGKNFLTLKHGSLLCANCFTQVANHDSSGYLAVSDNVIKLLRFILDNPLEYSSKLKIEAKLSKEIFNLSLNFMKFRF